MHPDFVESVREALFNPGRYEAEASAGRGSIHMFRMGEGKGILRHYQRGGIVQHIMKDGYFMDNRPMRELRVWCHAFESGIQAPLPLGIIWFRRGPFYHGAIAAQYIESEHLQAWLESDPKAESRKEVLYHAGESIRAMHAVNIVHADLQVRNILIDTDGKSWIIDFDDAVISETISDNARYRNLLRLRRSFQKNFLDLNDFDSLCEGYGLDTLPQALELVYSIKRKISDALGHSTGEADNK